MFTRVFKNVFIFLIVFSFSSSAFAGKLPRYIFPSILIAPACAALIYMGWTAANTDDPVKKQEITFLTSKISDAELREMMNKKALPDIQAEYPGATVEGTPHYMWVFQANVTHPKTLQPIPRTFRKRFFREEPNEEILTANQWIEVTYAYVANLKLADGKKHSFFNLYSHNLEKNEIVVRSNIQLARGNTESVKFIGSKDPLENAQFAVKLSKAFSNHFKPREEINRDWPIEEPKATGYHTVPYFDKSGKTKFLVFVTGIQKIFIVTPEADGATVEMLVEELLGNVG